MVGLTQGNLTGGEVWWSKTLEIRWCFCVRMGSATLNPSHLCATISYLSKGALDMSKFGPYVSAMRNRTNAQNHMVPGIKARIM